MVINGVIYLEPSQLPHVLINKAMDDLYKAALERRICVMKNKQEEDNGNLST